MFHWFVFIVETIRSYKLIVIKAIASKEKMADQRLPQMMRLSQKYIGLKVYDFKYQNLWIKITLKAAIQHPFS